MIRGVSRLIRIFIVAGVIILWNWNTSFYATETPVSVQVQNIPADAVPAYGGKFDHEQQCDVFTVYADTGISIQRNISAYEDRFDRGATLVMTMASSAQLTSYVSGWLPGSASNSSCWHLMRKRSKSAVSRTLLTYSTIAFN
mmetsp:Transcript_21426/g.46543  ORF Transcript_21426/g.46543 Transcript_21426/m.46543 type:complete len:142 (+) Transcript_21426:206-631(+)